MSYQPMLLEHVSSGAISPWPCAVNEHETHRYTVS